MPLPAARRPFARAGIVAAMVLAVWWFAAPRATMPPVSPMGDQLVYTTADDARLPLLEPVLHAPWIGERLPGAILAVVVLAAGTGLATVAGAGALSTLFVLLALVLDASFGAALAHQSAMVAAVGLIWLSAGGAFSEPMHPGPRPWARSLASILLWALAVWWHWMALVAWPIVLAGIRRRPDRPARGLWTLASLVAGGAACVAHFAWMASVAGQQAFAPDLSLSWRDALAVAFDSRPRLPLGSFVAPDLTFRLSFLAMALAAAGLVFGGLVRWWRRAVVLTAVLLAGVGLGWAEWQAEVLRFGAWLLAPLGAVGLTWASQQVTPSRRVLVTCALGTVLVVETAVMSARPLSGQDARGFRDALARDLAGVRAPGGMTIVAEDTRIDSALAAWMAGRPNVSRVAPDGAVVARALAGGRTVLAGPTAWRQLLLAGVRFSNGFVITEPAPLVMSVADDAFGCAAIRTDRWSLLPGVEYTGRIGVELPARLGAEMQVIVGDALPLALRVETPDGRPVPVVADALLSGPGVDAPPADYWIESGTPEDSPRIVRRLHLPAHPVRATLLSIRLGRRAPRVLARLIGFRDGARGRVCAAPVGPRVMLAGNESFGTVALDDHDAFGRGWYGVEQSGAGPARWTDADPVVLVQSAARTDVGIELDAAPPGATVGTAPTSGAAPGAVAAGGTAGGDRMTAPARRRVTATPTVTLRVNGVDVGTRAMVAGMASYTWAVPAGVWLAGANEVWWHVSPAVRPADTGGDDTRELGMRVSSIAVRRGGGAATAAR